MSLRVDGVDISHHQGGSIDYTAAKRAGVRWLYHKATEGATYVDPNYTRRRTEAKAAGIPFGAYHFARAEVGDAETEARAFLDVAKPRIGDLRPVLDLETTEGLTIAQRRTWAETWIKVVTAATGVKPIVYTPYDLGAAVQGCLIWRPRYGDGNVQPVLAWDIWQFSNGVYGKPDQVAGFGHVDLNVMRDGLAVADLLIPVKKPEPPKGDVSVATWNMGDGDDRMKARGLDRLVHHGANIIALQEAGDRQQMLDRWCQLTGWSAYVGRGTAGAPSVPILWNPQAVRALRMGTTPATPATKVGPLGAGPSVMKPKVWNHVRFDGPTDFVVINGHVVPSVYLPKRADLARRHIAVLADMAEHRLGRVDVIAVGDYNMKPGDKLTKPLRDLGMKQRTREGTHGRRVIDHIWTLGVDGRTEVVGMPSDHRAALFSLR